MADPRSKVPIGQRLSECSCEDPVTGCINWTAYKRFGYGFISYMGKQQRAHRLSFELANGPIPAGMVLCHRCDNPSCINPDHLFVGTQRENCLDAIEKGRAQLTEAQVVEIMRSTGLAKDVAKLYGVSARHIGYIRNGRTWKHLLDHREAANDSN